MERMHGELIERLARTWDVSVVSVAPRSELRELVEWHRIRIPRRPVPLMFCLFFVLAGLRLRSLRPGLVHVCGAIVPNRADVASVHLCHAGRWAATHRVAPSGAPPA